MADNIQRLNYHTGLFLGQEEFITEQNYHLLMRRRLNFAMFKPGVLFGMEVDYRNGVLTITPGMAIDEFADPTSGETLGREIVVLATSPAVNLSSFQPGNNVWITVRHAFAPTDPKPPTNFASRITETYVIETQSTDPGQGTLKILLGKIVIGTDSHTEPVQKATLKLGGGASPVPTPTSFSPTTGGIGTTVTITGGNFTGATAVSFGGIAASTFNVVSDTQITATVPPGAVTGPIRITTPAGSGNSTTNFQVVAAPTVTGFIPTRGGGGTVITITGSNFTGATAVSFGGIAASTFNVVSDTQISATVPPGAVTGPIRVTNPGGSGNSTTNFQVVPAPAFNVLNPFAPRSGFTGNPVGINGQNFDVDSPTAPQVFFGTLPATVTAFTATSIQVTVPAGGGNNQQVFIRVRTSGGEVASNNLTPPVPFTLNPS